VFFFILVGVGVLGANPFAGQTTGPFDLLMSRPAWNPEFQQVKVRNGERTDVVDAMLPRWMYARHELREGRLPLWNPLPGGGESGLHNLASSQLSPAFAAFVLAPSPASGVYAATLLNLVISGIGVWLWLRRRLGTLPAVFGGVTVMLCGFNAAWLYWPHMSTAAWTGWLLWSVEGWWRRPAAGWFLALAASTALLVLGGFPFVAELALGAAMLYSLALWYSERPTHAFARWLGQLLSTMLAFGLVSIPLMSFSSWLGHVDTAGRSGGSPLHLIPDGLRLLPYFAREMPAVEGQMYAGGIALVLAALAVVIHLVRAKRDPLVLFGMTAALVASTLVFELVPASWLSWVPGLGGNGWSRGIFLLDLAIAALAACALAWILPRLYSRWVAGFFAVPLILLQAIDLGASFRQFNGPVPSAWMFPTTAAIAEATRQPHAFTYVIADHQYIVSGTLGAYGLAEWYGHGFKSAALKSLLATPVHEPFTTPTASVIPPTAIDLRDPHLAALGVKYLLGDERLLTDIIEPDYARVDGPMKALPPLTSAPWVQHITLPSRFSLSRLDIRMATYEAQDVPGIVRALISDSQSGALVASSALPASVLVDGEMARFTFQPGTPLPAGEYALRLVHEGADPSRPLTVWVIPGQASNCRLEGDSVAGPGCLIMQMAAERAGLDGWRVAVRDRGFLLLENQNAPQGPYFLESLKAMPTPTASQAVSSQGDFYNGWLLKYTGTATGYLVMPMSFTRSWEFKVNGKPVTPQRYLDVMPALRVAGPAVVEARYAPRSIRVGRWVTLASGIALLLISIGLSWWSRRRGRG